LFVSFRRPLYVKDRTYGTGTVPDGTYGLAQCQTPMNSELVQCYASSVMNFLDSTGVQDGPDIAVANSTTSSKIQDGPYIEVENSYFTPTMSVYISFGNKGFKDILVHLSAYIIFRRCQLQPGRSVTRRGFASYSSSSRSGKCVQIVHSHMFIPHWKADSRMFVAFRRPLYVKLLTEPTATGGPPEPPPYLFISSKHPHTSKIRISSLLPVPNHCLFPCR
jgi:hypothetical protein